MVGHSVGTGEDSASFSVLSLAVAEEEGIAGGISVAESAGLAYEASGKAGGLGDGTVPGDDEILADDALAYLYGGIFRTVYGPVHQQGSTVDLGGGTHAHVADFGGTDYGSTFADGSAAGGDGFDIAVHDCVHLLHEYRAVAVHGYHVGLVR